MPFFYNKLNMDTKRKHIGIIGGGPAALFLFQKLVQDNLPIEISIFEKSQRLGAGMPYSSEGANSEHIANVSAHELPDLPQNVYEYLKENHVFEYPEYYDGNEFNKYKVLPRLLLGDYLESQFHELLLLADKKNIKVNVHLSSNVLDIVPVTDSTFDVILTDEKRVPIDIAVVCTGHLWKKINEGEISGWYDSPYPPSKLNNIVNTPVAIRGTSLTAIDAVKTLARNNGQFYKNDKGIVEYQLDAKYPKFRIDLFSTGGHLPAIRFHSEEEYFSFKWTMTDDEIHSYRLQNNGFVHLDYVFENSFKKPLKEKDYNFYKKIQNLSIEEFASTMLESRDRLNPFDLFRKEYAEAEKSIEEKKTITWKETLSAFSYAMNYPAKHFPAEDMLRLKKLVMPLITIIIAELPQSSAEEILALHSQNLLTLTEVDSDSEVKMIDGKITYCFKDENNTEIKKTYDVFVDSIGQKPLDFNEINFVALKEKGLCSEAFLTFKEIDNTDFTSRDENNQIDIVSGKHVLKVPGVLVGDSFEAVHTDGSHSDNLFFMAVPLIGGLHPDYSGLDFCATAAEKISTKISGQLQNSSDPSSVDVA